jgi:hypothetical protein
VKKIFLLITFIPLLSIAQSNKKQVDGAYGYSDNIIARYPTAGDTVLFEKIVPLQGLTRSQIVERTSKYILDTSADVSSIKKERQPDGELILSCLLKNHLTNLSISSMVTDKHSIRSRFTSQLDIKDNKLRVRVYNLYVNYGIGYIKAEKQQEKAHKTKRQIKSYKRQQVIAKVNEMINVYIFNLGNEISKEPDQKR